MTMKKGQRVLSCALYAPDSLPNPARYRKKLPALGALPNGEETGGEQLTM